MERNRTAKIFGEMHAHTASAAVKPQSGYWWAPGGDGRVFMIERNTDSGKVYVGIFLHTVDGRSSWQAAGPVAIRGGRIHAPINAISLKRGWPWRRKQPTLGVSPGSLTIAFSDEKHGTMTLPDATIQVERYLFSQDELGSAVAAAEAQTGFWWNPGEPGCGYTIERQGNHALVAACIFDAHGNPVWFSSRLKSVDRDRFHGDWISKFIEKTGGMSTNIGQIALAFESLTNARITLPGGRVVEIQRFTF
jgi:hypothetical protein